MKSKIQLKVPAKEKYTVTLPSEHCPYNSPVFLCIWEIQSAISAHYLRFNISHLQHTAPTLSCSYCGLAFIEVPENFIQILNTSRTGKGGRIRNASLINLLQDPFVMCVSHVPPTRFQRVMHTLGRSVLVVFYAYTPFLSSPPTMSFEVTASSTQGIMLHPPYYSSIQLTTSLNDHLKTTKSTGATCQMQYQNPIYQNVMTNFISAQNGLRKYTDVSADKSKISSPEQFKHFDYKSAILCITECKQSHYVFF